MKYFLQIISMIIITMIFSCAETKFTTVTDPEYKAVVFHGILVVANTSDINLRKIIEYKLTNIFRDNNIHSNASIEIFPPTREWNRKEIVDASFKYGIDAFLFVNIGERGLLKFDLPIITSTYYRENGSTTVVEGGEHSKPWSKFEVVLVDANNGKNAWIGQAFTGGNSFADFSNVYNSFCKETVAILLKQRLVSK